MLDVAGGKGLLSFELALVYGVPSTVVDVTKVRLSLFKSKKLLGLPLLNPSKGPTTEPTGDLKTLKTLTERCGKLTFLFDRPC